MREASEIKNYITLKIDKKTKSNRKGILLILHIIEIIQKILILHNLNSSVLASCLHQAVLRHNLLEIKNNLNRLWDHFHMNEFSEFETFAINVEVLLF